MDVKLKVRNQLDRVIHWFEDSPKNNPYDQQMVDYAINELMGKSNDELWAYYVKMNCWEWPFDNYKSTYNMASNNFFRRRNKHILVFPVFRYIKSRLSNYEQSKAWHLIELKSTEAEFEHWYKTKNDFII